MLGYKPKYRRVLVERSWVRVTHSKGWKVLFLALLLFSIAVSYGLGVVFDSMVLGFVVVGLFYVLLIGLYALLRDKLSSPLIKRFSIYYFD